MNKNDFLSFFYIDKSYSEFFSDEKIQYVLEVLKKLESNSEKFAPKKENIFKALEKDIKFCKVLILGKDPYFQENAATGLAFEVNGLESWSSPFPQRSLQNIVKNIYKSYENQLINFSEIRLKIKSNDFQIMPPNKLFKSWHNQGVILLNSLLTVKVDNNKNYSGSHMKYWKSFVEELIQYISKKNPNLSYFLWGNDAGKYEKFITNGTIFKSNHPALAFGKSPKDFLFFNGFFETKNIINWINYNTKK
ncbi:uracil-DNA glycosylase [Haliovirga abyssi]|uniref:uracil-DNA glycosylase n=1 Tax=Haliovirga abyssi TaxID=2996794 RepID=A0AAU9DYD0_9FUSO|nr:uracil-DNA glycosylase [Haliovirga abyssi]BDU51526.1 hypothetical protein HLVA_20950 [Haliovirga abyssi]